MTLKNDLGTELDSVEVTFATTATDYDERPNFGDRPGGSNANEGKAEQTCAEKCPGIFDLWCVIANNCWSNVFTTVITIIIILVILFALFVVVRFIIRMVREARERREEEERAKERARLREALDKYEWGAAERAPRRSRQGPGPGFARREGRFRATDEEWGRDRRRAGRKAREYA